MTFDLRHGLEVASHIEDSDVDAKVVAILHDAVEDGACLIDDLKHAGLSEEIVRSIRILTRGERERYTDYILRILSSDSRLAVVVKIADLQTNLARMDEEHATLLGRYQEALERLSSSRILGLISDSTQEPGPEPKP